MVLGIVLGIFGTCLCRSVLQYSVLADYMQKFVYRLSFLFYWVFVIIK